jgi:hypothetical protein
MRIQKRDLALHALLACVVWSSVGPLLAQNVLAQHVLAQNVLAQNDRIYWMNNYREAVREAKQTQKPIFLEFRCEA